VAFPGASYESAVLHLAPGDSLVLFTDGVTEALNPADDLYGEDRLVARLAQLRGATPAQIVAAVQADVNRFAEGAPQADDTTILAIAWVAHGNVAAA
jgi:sigma-B regulation protein RsbU (phosphoserine phosphatase)